MESKACGIFLEGTSTEDCRWGHRISCKRIS